MDYQLKKITFLGKLILRALCYFHLIQFYQQTYIGHEQAPGVPLYITPTTSSTPGNPRGTVEEVYARIKRILREVSLC